MPLSVDCNKDAIYEPANCLPAVFIGPNEQTRASGMLLKMRKGLAGKVVVKPLAARRRLDGGKGLGQGLRSRAAAQGQDLPALEH